MSRAEVVPASFLAAAEMSCKEDTFKGWFRARSRLNFLIPVSNQNRYSNLSNQTDSRNWDTPPCSFSRPSGSRSGRKDRRPLLLSAIQRHPDPRLHSLLHHSLVPSFQTTGFNNDRSKRANPVSPNRWTSAMAAPKSARSCPTSTPWQISGQSFNHLILRP
jgi:hypothetical protein